VSTATAGGAQATFGVEQEHARSHDLFADRHSTANLYAIGELDTEGDGARLEAISYGDEDVLLHSGVDHGISRDRGHLSAIRFEYDASEEAWSKLAP